MRTTFVATLPDGSIAKRQSESRTYSHCVAARPSFERAVSRARETAGDMDQWQYLTKCASVQPGEKYPDPRYRFEVKAESHEKGRALVEKYGQDRDAYVVDQVAARIAAEETRKRQGFYDKWSALSWSSRLGLAEKAASTARQWNAEVRVVEAVVQ